MMPSTLTRSSARCLRTSGFAMMVIGSVLTLSACKPDFAAPPAQDLNSLVWSLTLNHHAVTLSTRVPYDTVQLVAIPQNVHGVVLQDQPVVVYTTTDTTIRLSETGFVKASSPTRFPGARVIAKITNGVMTQVDTVYIHVQSNTVIANPPQTFRVVRTDADSGYCAIGASYVPSPVDTLGGIAAAFLYPNPAFGVRVTAENGETIQPSVYFVTSDNTIASINRTTGSVVMLRPGTITVYATAYIYGRMVQDSTRFVITPPLFSTFSFGVSGSAWIYSAHVGVGAVINWTNWGSSPVDVEFEDPGAAKGIQYGVAVSDSGNIRGLGEQKNARRRFMTPGVYQYRILTQPPIAGSITVIPQ